jgi:hypothetical protein
MAGGIFPIWEAHELIRRWGKSLSRVHSTTGHIQLHN